MPFGGEHLRVKGGNEMLHLLPQWCHLWQCGPSRGIPDHPVGENHSWEHPASAYWLPIEEAAVKVAKEEAVPVTRPLEEPSTSWTPNKESTRRNIHQIDSLGGGKCYIPQGQSLLPGRSLWSPKVPNRDLVAKVLGKGWLDTEGQRNRFKTQGQSPHCQQGCWKPCSKWYHLQASWE